VAADGAAGENVILELRPAYFFNLSSNLGTRLDYNQSGFKFNRETGELESKIGAIRLNLHRPLPEGKIEGVQIVKQDR